MALRTLTISMRVFAGFLSVLVLLAAVGTAGVVGFGTAREQFASYGAGAEVAIAGMEVQTDIGILLRAAQGYAATGRDLERSTVATVGQRMDAAIQQATSGTVDAIAAITAMVGAIDRVAAAVTDTGAAADRVLHAADDLSIQSDHLRREVGRFLTQVRRM